MVTIDDDVDVDVVSLVVVATVVMLLLLTQTPRMHVPLLKLLPLHADPSASEGPAKHVLPAQMPYWMQALTKQCVPVG